MTLLDQIHREKRQRAIALNEPLRAEADPNKYRSDGDRLRLAETDQARVQAEGELNHALIAAHAAREAVGALAGRDWGSLGGWEGGATRTAGQAVARAKEANVAVVAAREKLTAAIRQHRAAVQAIDASAAARRRAAKREAGQMA